MPIQRGEIYMVNLNPQYGTASAFELEEPDDRMEASKVFG